MKSNRTVVIAIAAMALVAISCPELFAQDSGGSSAGIFRIILQTLRELSFFGAVILLMFIISLVLLLANFITVRFSYLCPAGDYNRLRKMLQDGALDKAQQLVDKRYNFQSYVVKAAMKTGDVYHFFVDETMDKETVKCHNRPTLLLFVGIFTLIFAAGSSVFKWTYYYWITRHDYSGSVMDLREKTLFLTLALLFGALIVACLTIPFYVLFRNKARKITVDAKYKTTELLELLEKHHAQAQAQTITEKMSGESGLQDAGTEEQDEETDTAQQEQPPAEQPPAEQPPSPEQPAT